MDFIFNSGLSFEDHRPISGTKWAWQQSEADVEILIYAFVTSKLDYSNSLFAGLPEASSYKTQCVEKSAVEFKCVLQTRTHLSLELALSHPSVLCLNVWRWVFMDTKKTNLRYLYEKEIVKKTCICGRKALAFSFQNSSPQDTEWMLCWSSSL